MGWQDSFGFLDYTLRQAPYRPSGYRPFSVTSPRSTFGAPRRTAGVAWSDLATGRLAGSRPPSSPAAAVGAPERFEVSLPYSSAGSQNPYAPTPVRPVSTKGDILGSIQGAGANLFSNLNLANVVPFMMERFNVLAGDLADAHVPVVSDVARAAHPATQAFIDAVGEVARPVGQLMDAFPTWVRDSQLSDRAKLYRAIARGEVPDYGVGPLSNPLATFAQVGSFIANPTGYAQRTMAGESPNLGRSLTGETVSDQAYQAKQWQDALLKSVDPAARMEAERRLSILRDSIDLPESVKLAIDRSPGASDDEISKWLTDAPEGRLWSYQPGLASVFQNMATPLLFYIAEAKGAGSALGAAGGSSVPGVATASRLASSGISKAATLATVASASGIGITGLNTTLDAVARYAGADDAVAWFDNANRSTDFSDDPMIQLSTGFAVNPLRAINMATKGGAGRVAIGLRNGLSAAVDRATGNRMVKFYTSDDRMHDVMRRMFKLGSIDETAAFIDEQGLRAQSHDMVMSVALDTVLDRLPKDERLAWNTLHPNPDERAAATMTRFGEEAMNLIEHQPDLVAARFNEHAWHYHGMPGTFNAEVAAKNARLFRAMVDRTYDLRAGQRLVVGYAELLGPDGQAAARRMLDEATTADGNVPLKAFQEMVVDLPALRKHWAGLPMGESLPRASVETVIDRASAEFAHTAKVNPVKAATGVDPVLRTDSATPLRDQADAFGTDIETIEAVRGADVKDAAAVERVRSFLREKVDLDESFTIDKLEPDAVFARGARYLDDTGVTWRARGARAQAADRLVARLTDEMAGLRALPKSAAREAAISELEARLTRIHSVVSDAVDPIAPFSHRAALARLDKRFLTQVRRMSPDRITPTQEHRLHDFLAAQGQPTGTPAEMLARAKGILEPKSSALDMAYRDAAERVAEARHTLDRLDLIDVTMEQMGAPQMGRLFTKVEGNLMFSGGLPHISRAMRERIAGIIGGARTVQQTSDYELWRTILKGDRRPDIIAGLTKRQREMVRNVEYGTPRFPSGPDEFAAAWRETADAPARGDEQWTEAAVKLLQEREALLGGRPRIVVEAIAASQLPAEFITEAMGRGADGFGASGYYDAIWEAQTHPQNIARMMAAIDTALENPSPEAADVVRSIMNEDGLLISQLESSEPFKRLAEVADDPWLMNDGSVPMLQWIRRNLVPEGFEPPSPVPAAETELDQAIAATNRADIERLIQTTRQKTREIAPLTIPRSGAAKVVAIAKTRRLSTRYTRDLRRLGVDPAIAPNADILDNAANTTGRDVLSVLNHGQTGTRPATIGGVIRLLNEIENGHASGDGLSAAFQAEGQRVAQLLLEDAVRAAKRAQDPNLAGVFTKGGFVDDEARVAATINDLMSYDAANPLGALTYGFKKAPKDRVVMEWSQIPGLAEEMFAKRFQPWEERVGTTHIRQAFNWIFGEHSNSAVRADARNRFFERLATQGVSQETGKAIWDRWYEVSHDSRAFKFIGKNRAGREYVQGDWATYADPWNIPNSRLDGEVHGSSGHNTPGVLNDLLAKGKITNEEYALARNIDYANEFRNATSFIRRSLAESKLPLGQALARAYGSVVHSPAATTFYYMFRFGMDVRYHAMNYLEAQILYMGRAGLRNGELDEAVLLGANPEGYLRNLDADPVSNTGYSFTRERHHWAYRTFVKEQSEQLGKGLKGLASEDPALMRKAMEQLAQSDPQLRDMVDAMAATPQKYLKELDDWHRKMLANVDEADDASVIDRELAVAQRDSPELAEVFGRLGQINKDWWSNVRETFYGNPDRSRAERALNHYLLFWPLSYQIKSTKWFLRVLFDRAGGLQTNAVGAIAMDRVAEAHNRLLATDPNYRDWMEKHRTLVFVAQMLFPVSFDQMGVSLNPALRSIFFDTAKNVLEVGPIYTANKVIKPLAEELYADLYPSFGDWINGPFKSVTGKKPPKVEPGSSP